MIGRAPGRTDRAAKERQSCSQVTRPRQPAVEYLTLQIDAATQVVRLAQDSHVRLIHQPRPAHWLPVPADLLRQRWAELLDPAQDRPPARVDATVGQDAGDTFGRSAKLQVVADRQQNDVTWKPVTVHQAGRLGRGVAATRAAGVNRATALVRVRLDEEQRGQESIVASLRDPLTPRQCRRTPRKYERPPCLRFHARAAVQTGCSRVLNRDLRVDRATGSDDSPNRWPA